VPVFVLLIWLHTPLWRYFANLIGALASDTHRRLVIAALAGVSLACLVMFAMVFDYSRWISNWAVCMFLILHAVKMLPALRETPLIPAEDQTTNIFGLIVTLIPRVGIVRPF
jgi:multisubunit Na+/H+ antiporter MnhE subunit